MYDRRKTVDGQTNAPPKWAYIKDSRRNRIYCRQYPIFNLWVSLSAAREQVDAESASHTFLKINLLSQVVLKFISACTGSSDTVENIALSGANTGGSPQGNVQMEHL